MCNRYVYIGCLSYIGSLSMHKANASWLNKTHVTLSWLSKLATTERLYKYKGKPCFKAESAHKGMTYHYLLPVLCSVAAFIIEHGL